MKLPKKLQEKMDEMSFEFVSKQIIEPAYLLLERNGATESRAYRVGFNACAAELLPLLKEFLAHYNKRQITNGYHDLLAAKIERKLGKL